MLLLVHVCGFTLPELPDNNNVLPLPGAHDISGLQGFCLLLNDDRSVTQQPCVSVRSEEERLHARQGDVPTGGASKLRRRSQRVSSVNETDAVRECLGRTGEQLLRFESKPRSRGARPTNWKTLHESVHAHCVIAGILHKKCRTRFKHLNRFFFSHE